MNHFLQSMLVCEIASYPGVEGPRAPRTGGGSGFTATAHVICSRILWVRGSFSKNKANAMKLLSSV